MEIRVQNQNSQLFTGSLKYQKDSPIHMSLNPTDHQESKPLKGVNRQIILAIIERINNLERRIDELEKMGVEHVRRKKKIRRKAKDIHRNYKCSYSSCEKIYGSKTSLKNHMKLKHGYRMRRYVLQNKQNRSE